MRTWPMGVAGVPWMPISSRAMESRLMVDLFAGGDHHVEFTGARLGLISFGQAIRRLVSPLIATGRSPSGAPEHGTSRPAWPRS